jgi:uridine kinase
MSLFNAQLSNAQIAKVRDFIAKQMKKARKQFVEVNGDYHDIVIDRDVQLLVKALTDDANWISRHRSKIAHGVPALENILDEIVSLYLTTIYKLKNLS